MVVRTDGPVPVPPVSRRPSCPWSVLPRPLAFEAHGSAFLPYVSPSRGSCHLCAWRLTVPPDLRGVAHRPTREEVLLVLGGDLQVTVDGYSSTLRCGDAGLVPAHSLPRRCQPTVSVVATVALLAAVVALGIRPQLPRDARPGTARSGPAPPTARLRAPS